MVEKGGSRGMEGRFVRRENVWYVISRKVRRTTMRSVVAFRRRRRRAVDRIGSIVSSRGTTLHEPCRAVVFAS